jgi:hypothetical protein
VLSVTTSPLSPQMCSILKEIRRPSYSKCIKFFQRIEYQKVRVACTDHETEGGVNPASGALPAKSLLNKRDFLIKILNEKLRNTTKYPNVFETRFRTKSAQSFDLRFGGNMMRLALEYGSRPSIKPDFAYFNTCRTPETRKGLES